jgi:xanthine dehydrogenase YagS FAD-binding subunit
VKSFVHFNAHTVHEACTVLEQYNGKAKLNAGGTDLFLTLKGDILPHYPKAVVNIKNIPHLGSTRVTDKAIIIGVLATLSDISKSKLLHDNCRVLVEAAHSVASPQIRNAATVGGNLCQDVRCWYYRYPRHIGGPIHCLRKGNGPCLAIKGDNRYHAIMGGIKCFAVCPSDTAVALAALNAQIIIASPEGTRSISILDFFNPLGNTLQGNEMVTEIVVPKAPVPGQQTFLKFTLRSPIDFAIVSVASFITMDKDVCIDARIALGAVGPGPLRAKTAEDFLKGRILDKKTAIEASELALTGSKPLSGNAYKVEIAKTLVKRAILS